MPVFSHRFDFFSKNAGKPGLTVIEIASALVGRGLSGFLIEWETGSHISPYWTSSNRIAAAEMSLAPFIGPEEAYKARRHSDYRAGFPKFCTRLQILAALFAVVHVGAAALLVCS